MVTLRSLILLITGIDIDKTSIITGLTRRAVDNDGDDGNDGGDDGDGSSSNIVVVNGVCNVGNSCYLSVLLQLFASSKSFVSFVKKLKQGIRTNSNRNDGRYINELLHCFRTIRRSSRSSSSSSSRDAYGNVYNPSAILNCIPSIRGCNTQQDSHEVFNIMLAMLTDLDNRAKNSSQYSLVPSSLETVLKTNATPFTGLLCHSLTCQACKKRRPIKHETFTSLILPIPNQKEVTLYDCLDLFTADETLDDIECSSCSLKKTITQLNNRLKAYESLKNKHVDELKESCNDISQYYIAGETDEYCRDFDEPVIAATHTNTYTLLLNVRTTIKKETRISRLPDLLCLVLNPLLTGKIKRNSYIKFPMELDMAPFFVIRTISDARYLLQSVIVHEGNASMGHYSIFTRCDENSENWYWISDTQVTIVSNISSIFNHIKAYILVYKNIRK